MAALTSKLIYISFGHPTMVQEGIEGDLVNPGKQTLKSLTRSPPKAGLSHHMLKIDRNELQIINYGVLNVPKDMRIKAVKDLPIVTKDTDCILTETNDELKLATLPSPSYKEPALTPQKGPLLLGGLERRILLIGAYIDQIDDFIERSQMNKPQTEFSKYAGFAKLLEHFAENWPREQWRLVSTPTPNSDKKAPAEYPAHSNEKGKAKVNEDKHLTSTKRKRPAETDNSEDDVTGRSKIRLIQKKGLSCVSSPGNKQVKRVEYHGEVGGFSGDRWSNKRKGDGWGGDLELEIEAKVREMEDTVEELNALVEELADCFKGLAKRSDDRRI
ncbi:hypothetical protein DFP73DRAFT_636162 [Morchella snyderi]|nr:hypothetical protein DFP73DRAFT_636162 [Morchella snyderi]